MISNKIVNDKIHVLCVDDEPDFLNLQKELLQKEESFEVETVNSVSDAFQLLDKKSFDVIVSDYQMPVKDGLQFLREFQKKKIEIPFILLTGKGREEVAIHALNLGAHRYIKKGIDIEAMNTELIYEIKQCYTQNKFETSLKESEENYRLVTETCIEGIYRLDISGNFLFVNNAYTKMVGYRIDELIGKSFSIIIGGEHEQINENWSILLSGRSLTGEMVVKRKNGTIFPAYFSAAPIMNGKKVISITGSLTDVTEINKIKDDLLESEEKYRVIVENSPNLVFIIQDMQIVYANNAMINRIDYSLKELSNPKFNFLDEIFYKYPKWDQKKKYNERLNGKEFSRYQTKILSKKGEEIDVSVFGKKISYNKTLAIMYILIDISERVKIEFEKIDALQKLSMSVSHDIRNPLSIINAITYLLKTTVGSKEKNMLKIIENNIRSVEHILNNLLDFSNESKIHFIDISVNEIIKNIFSELVVPKTIKTITKLNSIQQINIDEQKIKRVLINIITNAIQSMPEGGKLTVLTDSEKNVEKITIADTGCGIEQKNISKLFKTGYTTKIGGKGLGLYTAKNVIEKHNGSIKIGSEEGKGTTVIIKLH